MQRLSPTTFTLLFTALCSLAVFPARAATPRAEQANHSIGFRVLERTDASRVSPRFPKGRPIQISLWYPAASAPSPLTYRDYYLLSTRELSFEPMDKTVDREALAKFTSFLASAGVKPKDAQTFLSTKMRASRNAAPVPGRFPLIQRARQHLGGSCRSDRELPGALHRRGRRHANRARLLDTSHLAPAPPGETARPAPRRWMKIRVEEDDRRAYRPSLRRCRQAHFANDRPRSARNADEARQCELGSPVSP